MSGTPMVGKTVVLEAQVGNPTPSQRIKLTLPPGLTLVDGDADRPVPAGADSLHKIPWTVRADRAGDYSVGLELSDGDLKKWQLHVADAPAVGPLTALDAQRA